MMSGPNATIAACTPLGMAMALLRVSRQELQVRRRFDGSDTYFEIGVDLVIGVSPAPTAADHDPDNREDKEDALPAIETEFPHGASLAQQAHR